ncbi:MAG: TonB-dependent receptor [Luteolibacter sp.]
MKLESTSQAPSFNLNQPTAKDTFAITGAILAISQITAPAQAEQNQPSDPENPDTLPELIVEAEDNKNLYKPEKLATGKYTVPLVDVPQTVNVIPQDVIREQGASNLREVLKNVPGISIQAGEGGVPPGDNLSIRGFSARTDLFVDGVRDFGGYTRDPFNTEQVEVIKGPSSSSAGRGSTGGSVNLSSKTPHLGNETNILLGAGTDSYGRATFDINQEIPNIDNAAFRLNGLYHTQDIAGRDDVTQERWGIAPSISFGLGTDTRFTLSYFHLDQDNVPDYGIPFVGETQEEFTGLTAGQPPVNDSNFYGLLDRDFEKIQTDIFTATFEHDFSENLKLRNITRYGRNEADIFVTAPRFFNSGSIPDGAPTTAVNRTFRDRLQTDEIFSNQTELRYDFQTGTISHELIATLEASRETSEFQNRIDENSDLVPYADLYNPTQAAYTPNLQFDGDRTETTADSLAISLFDTIKLNEQWTLSGGIRWESFDVDYTDRESDEDGGAITNLSRKDEEFSYRAAVTYKPCENGSIYLGYGTSFNPSAEGLRLSDSTTSSRGVDLDPEQSRTIELGTKWDLLDDRLLVNAALFRTDKTNARTLNEIDDILTVDGEQRVQGLEFGFTGLITDQWRVLGGYTYLDGEVTSSLREGEQGRTLGNTPEHSFNLWTVYDLPKGLQVGLGMNYVDSRTNSTTSSTIDTAPSYVTFDALIGYRLNDNVSFRLNIYNLGDEDYISAIGGSHYVPGAGRSATLTAEITF